MFRLLVDENFDNDIVHGVLRRTTEVDLVRVQDVGLAGVDDPEIMVWAAQENRFLLTHDVETITKFAYERIAAGLPVAGVFEIRPSVPTGVAIEEILLITQYSEQSEWKGNVHYLPLKNQTPKNGTTMRCNGHGEHGPNSYSYHCSTLHENSVLPLLATSLSLDVRLLDNKATHI